MPCAFHAKRPYPFRKLGPGCQFAEDPDHPLVESGGAQWCRFHLPLDAPDADGVRKADWDETAAAAFNDAVFAHIDAAKAAGEVADLTGVVFPGGIAFDRYRGEEAALPAICFIEAHFGGDADFSEAHFCGTTDFRFGRTANFREARFGRTADFREAYFSEAHFGGDANFREARFGRTADFREAYFSEAHFGGTTDFREAHFGGTHNFRFLGGTDFREAHFGDYVDFREAHFGGTANFREAHFGGTANFREDHFGRTADFSEVHFGGTANFREAHFGRNTYFRKSQFGGTANFREDHFGGNAYFSGAAEDGRASERRETVALESRPGDEGETLTAGAITAPARVARNDFQRADFSRAWFGGPSVFSNRRFTDTTKFVGATFDRAPRFHNAVLHQDTDFTKAEFLDKSGEAAPAYRTLKLAMEQVRARDEEGMFYALEMESRRRRDDTPKAVWLFSLLYKAGSDYGRSLVRPLVLLGGVTFLFYLLYAALGADGWEVDLSAPLRLAMEQIVRPFALPTVDYARAASTSEYAAWAQALVDNAPFVARALGLIPVSDPWIGAEGSHTIRFCDEVDPCLATGVDDGLGVVEDAER